MSYEQLPTKFTHHLYEHCEHEGIVNPDPIKVMWKSLPGISLLATCRLVNEEAGAILSPRLKVLKRDPCRIVTTPEGLQSDSMERIVDHLAHSKPKDTDNMVPRDIIHIAVCLSAIPGYLLSYEVEDFYFSLCVFQSATNKYAAANGVGFHICLRPALLSTAEEALYKQVSQEDSDRPFSKPRSPVTEGANIKQVEWDNDWAESKRCF
jgi:hypothetical protein